MAAESIDLSQSVPYHTGAFPPISLDLSLILDQLLRATEVLARFEQALVALHNSEIFLAPLRNQEAVISSRMEGTISTMDEILEYQAESPDETPEMRSEIFETILYRRALSTAQKKLDEGYPLSISLIRSIHAHLLSHGRGASKAPGHFKQEQNYIGDRGSRVIRFTPIAPEHLQSGMEALMTFIESGPYPPLLKIALAHLEFEALHPFMDGNGRVGRMLITLMLWKTNLISAPHFYISRYFEDHKEEYIHLMRETSHTRRWEAWCGFFLNAVHSQAIGNLEMAQSIRELYESMKHRLTSTLSSKWSVQALDYIFTYPIFNNSRFARETGIPTATAARFTRALLKEQLLEIVRPASGQRPATYRFEPLMRLVRV